MKQLRHVLALTLVFCMVFGMVTPSLAVSGEISVEEDYGIPVEEDGGIEIEVDDRSDYDIDEDRENCPYCRNRTRRLTRRTPQARLTDTTTTLSTLTAAESISA